MWTHFMLALSLLTLISIIPPGFSQECSFVKARDPKRRERSAALAEDCPCFSSYSSSDNCDLGAYNPREALLPCSYLPQEFIECDLPVDHKGNLTSLQELGYGCLNFGGQRWEDVHKTKVCCKALECIECRGNRTFLREGYV